MHFKGIMSWSKLSVLRCIHTDVPFHIHHQLTVSFINCCMIEVRGMCCTLVHMPSNNNNNSNIYTRT